MEIKNKKRLAAFGIALTGVLLVAHVGFTVAWYNGSSNLAIYNFDIKLANKELKISVDDVTFSDHLTNDDIKDAIPDKYKPVSSAFSNNWMNQHANVPQFTLGYDSKPTSEDMTSFREDAIATNGFFRKDLYLTCTSGSYVTLDSDFTYVNADREANRSIASKLQRKVEEYRDMTIDQIEDYLNSIENSLRFSILVLDENPEENKYQIFDPHKNGITKLGGLLDTDMDDYYDSFNGKEVIYGDVEDSSKAIWSDNEQPADQGNKGTNSCFDAAHKQGIHTLDFEESKTNGMIIKEEQSLSLSELNQFKFFVSDTESTHIVLSLYIEGWDTDSVNYTMFSRFVTAICFKLA